MVSIFMTLTMIQTICYEIFWTAAHSAVLENHKMYYHYHENKTTDIYLSVANIAFVVTCLPLNFQVLILWQLEENASHETECLNVSMTTSC